MTILATIPSKSNPSKSYQVRKGDDGVIYCTCPAWAFSGKKPGGHDCKHLRALRASMEAYARRVASKVAKPFAPVAAPEGE
jgi:predicted nucleic acid-binding Zn finger protein